MAVFEIKDVNSSNLVFTIKAKNYESATITLDNCVNNCIFVFSFIKIEKDS